MDKELRAKYPESDDGMFCVYDSTSTPHPFCITHKHVAYASDHCCGRLGNDAIKASGAPCGVRGCQLSIDEHEKVLIIGCNTTKELEKIKDNLQKYLLSIKDQAESEGVAGFAFMKITE